MQKTCVQRLETHYVPPDCRLSCPSETALVIFCVISCHGADVVRPPHSFASAVPHFACRLRRLQEVSVSPPTSRLVPSTTRLRLSRGQAKRNLPSHMRLEVPFVELFPSLMAFG